MQLNANIDAVRKLARMGATSEDMAEVIGIDINVVRLICHAQKDFEHTKQWRGGRTQWVWKLKG